MKNVFIYFSRTGFLHTRSLAYHFYIQKYFQIIFTAARSSLIPVSYNAFSSRALSSPIATYSSQCEVVRSIVGNQYATMVIYQYATMVEYQYTTMVICQYATMVIYQYANMTVNQYATMVVYQYATMTVNQHATIVVYQCATMTVNQYATMVVNQYATMTVNQYATLVVSQYATIVECLQVYACTFVLIYTHL